MMEIKNIDIQKLIPYENNPRFNDDAVDYVAESIREFGFKVPLVVSKDFVIVTGHTRYKASQKQGIKKVPCIIADDLSESELNAFRIIDNKTSEYAGWDYMLLDEELSKIEGVDMKALGFALDEFDGDIDELFNSTEEKKKDKEPKRVKCEHCGEWFEV